MTSCRALFGVVSLAVGFISGGCGTNETQRIVRSGHARAGSGAKPWTRRLEKVRVLWLANVKGPRPLETMTRAIIAAKTKGLRLARFFTFSAAFTRLAAIIRHERGRPRYMVAAGCLKSPSIPPAYPVRASNV